MAETHHFDVNRLFGVKGYVAVVTGGGTGIGLMAAQALSANGAKVYITGRRTDALEKAASEHTPDQEHTGGQIIPLGPCDVTKKEDLQKVVDELSKKEKYINLLVCNAGIPGPKGGGGEEDAKDLKKKLWENESVEDWQTTMETDVTSVYFTTVAFLPLLQSALGSQGASNDTGPAGVHEDFAPSVITISSMSGLMRHAQGHFAYNAAKGATVHLTKLMSSEFQEAKIRVNSIAPGYFPSEMTAKESDERNKSGFPEGKIEQTGHVPLMRAGRDEEIGMTVLFLAKNCYVNGQILAVDGGVLNVVAG
ncbi:Short-chain dehydrogenase/reductase VdtF [Fulvia fulva]|uniref:Short-chain dehydrogenase/reductase VdtF n=1 Tax=Passalora fulva TaxID=5499 RepID=A0A9Q8PKS4_PASFU|nr:Short-chain dehydrogenase/reductase VdtF [Fulvia fulva]KAK4610673.1 Short-chain dehydrogenase/reductase VdtF [Fulvia fulva]KAK4611287.1 Short-chain dehydrogenase/reductase VdtF [Fulvia fulva]UJO24199.1 Short-chain dehydrogenase/reductase VdtF [Fulvia fulva]WPV22239.1 Short-chain dehydrogenase/reductase VdtF [Fulvia fulva]WPV37129.1 Short-chain dehydrogenase/reductase VdtF [Fulvia fulva]